MKNNLSAFKHKYTVKVQFHEVDLLGVCNNAVYFNFFETARLEYMKALGVYREKEEVLHSSKFYLIVHNECDYIEPAFFDDELNIYTRISYIKNSSFGFEHIVERTSSKKVIAQGKGVIVHIDRKQKKSTPLPEEFYAIIKGYESNVEILKAD